MQAGVTTRVSTAANGSQAFGDSSGGKLSADGRYVVFTSSASNLVSGDTNDCNDVFVKDLQTGAITRASIGADGTQADSTSGGYDISDDGRNVVLFTFATNLLARHSLGYPDVLIKALQTGALTYVSTGAVAQRQIFQQRTLYRL
ncbi:MAG: hypothetical protein H7Y60_03255 [Rhodospirillaceae bacterium]|nr:hypothetical protein [Rhodospirillales bacterium]